MEEIKVTAQFLRDLHGCECMPDVKAAIEKHFADVVKPEQPPYDMTSGSILIRRGWGEAYIACSSAPGYMGNADPFVLSCLGGGGNWSSPQSKSEILDDGFRPMRSGIIEIRVDDYRVAGATVKED